MFQPHPNLAPEINARIAESELAGGIFVYDPGTGQALERSNILQVGKTLRITTKNHVYLLKKVTALRNDPDFLISGHPKYCPTPTPCYVSGSTWGSSMIKVGYVGRGMRLEVLLKWSADEEHYKTIITSEIQEIEESEK